MRSEPVFYVLVPSPHRGSANTGWDFGQQSQEIRRFGALFDHADRAGRLTIDRALGQLQECMAGSVQSNSNIFVVKQTAQINPALQTLANAFWRLLGKLYFGCGWRRLLRFFTYSVLVGPVVKGNSMNETSARCPVSGVGNPIVSLAIRALPLSGSPCGSSVLGGPLAICARSACNA